MKRLLLRVLLVVSWCAVSATAQAAAGDCKLLWGGFETKSAKLSTQEKITQWAEMGGNCQPAGYYYYQLARLYTVAGDITQAKKYVDQGLALNDKARRYVEYMDLSIRFMTISPTAAEESEMSKLENDAAALIAKYADWGLAYAFMASIKLARDDYQQAIEYANKSKELEGGLTPHAGRTLGVAYAMAEQYREALKVGNEASAIDNALFADKYFMLAMVRSYIALENYDTGAKVLKLLVRSNPSLQSDRDVQVFANFLMNRIKEKAS